MLPIRMRALGAVAAVAALSVVPTFAASPATWTVEMLPMAADWAAAGANDVNAGGFAVGTYRSTEGFWGTACWDKAGAHDVATYIGMPSGFEDAQGAALNVNDNGAFVGYAYHTWDQVAVVWDPATGTAENLQPASMLPSWWASGAQGLNDRGDVVGYLVGDADSAPWYRTQGYRWSHDGNTDGLLLPVAGLPESAANGVNSSGTAVGWSFRRTPTPPEYAFTAHATIWPATGDAVDLHPVLAAAIPGTVHSYARDVSETGVVTGLVYVDPVLYTAIPYTWSQKDGVTVLGNGGTNVGNPLRINNAGICGSIGDVWMGEDVRAAVWEKGVLTALPMLPGYHMMELSGIGRDGLVAGYANATLDVSWWDAVPLLARKANKK